MLQPLASHSHHAHMAHEIERNHQALIQILGRPYPVLYADSKAMFVSNQDAPWFHRFFIEKFSLSDRAETAGLLSKIKDAVARGSHNDFKLFGQEEDNCKDPSSVGVFGSSSFPYLERHLGKWKTIGEEIEMAKEMHTLDDLASLGGSTFSSSKDPRITFNIRRILPSEAS